MKKHSFLTKYVVAVIPRKETPLLDTIMVEVTRDFISLFEEGSTLPNGERWFAAITGLKGDLKWFVDKVGFLKRCFNKQLAINAHTCHECLAGTADLPFEDASHCPTWAQTIYSERPFDVQPVLAWYLSKLKDPMMMTTMTNPFQWKECFVEISSTTQKSASWGTLWASLWAVWSCCCANWTTSMRRGSPMDVNKYCIVPTAIFICLATLLDEALAFVHLVPHFSMLLLGIASSSKGSDTSHLLAWIAVLTTGLLIDPISPGHLVLLRYIKNTAMSARTFLRLIYGHGLWLRRHCIAAVHQNNHSFLQGYNACAFLSMNQFQFTGFAMKSKSHMLAHSKVDIYRMLQNSDTEYFLNMLIWGCGMNEDVIGKVCRLSRKVSTRKFQRTIKLD